MRGLAHSYTSRTSLAVHLTLHLHPHCCPAQVLNMKPPEILSLLEEAAGTKLYEKKKDQSLKVLEKKQAKLEQIDQVGAWPAVLARCVWCIPVCGNA
jgi:hypothetical protein